MPQNGAVTKSALSNTRSDDQSPVTTYDLLVSTHSVWSCHSDPWRAAIEPRIEILKS